MGMHWRVSLGGLASSGNYSNDDEISRFLATSQNKHLCSSVEQHERTSSAASFHGDRGEFIFYHSINDRFLTRLNHQFTDHLGPDLQRQINQTEAFFD